MNKIGTLSENSLHAEIKKILLQENDRIEEKVKQYIIDIVRGDALIEIQTSSFYKLKPKLTTLLCDYPIQIVHPIPVEKWITRQDQGGGMLSRRKSPQRKSIFHVFNQLIYLTDFLIHPNLSLQVLLIHQDDFLMNDGKGSWRRKGWSLTDQHLIKIVDQYHLQSKEDYLDLLPPQLASSFTTSDLAREATCPIRLARKISYTLARIGVLTLIGKDGKQNRYTKTNLTNN